MPPTKESPLPMGNPGTAPPSTAVTLLYACWALLLLVLCWQALSWPLMQDTPILHYTAWLIDQGYVPYRDVFEMNLPGAWGIHLLGIKLFGSHVDAVPLLDTLWLTVTLLSMAFTLRRFGSQVAFTGALLLGTVYRMGGPMDVLQRDYLMLAPILLSVGLWLSPTHAPLGRFLSGLLLGFAALIKPQVLALLPFYSLHFALTYSAVSAPTRSRSTALFPHLMLWTGAGVSLGIGGLLLAYLGALPAFIELWRQYLGPLYSHLDGMGMEYSPGPGLYWDSLQEALRTLLYPSRLALVGGAILGSWTLIRTLKTVGVTAGLHAGVNAGINAGVNAGVNAGNAPEAIATAHRSAPTQTPPHATVAAPARPTGTQPSGEQPPTPASTHARRSLFHGLASDLTSLALFLALTVYGLAHVIIGVKQWWYHWWPFYGACLCLTSLLALRRTGQILLSLFGILVLSVAIVDKPHEPRLAEALAPVLQLTQTLKQQSHPGDRIQVLDTVGGGVHAALRAGLLPGSPFIYDFHFFHHTGTPYIQLLRQRLMQALVVNPPRFVVAWHSSWSHRLSYADLARFPALDLFLTQHYAILEVTTAYRLLEYQQKAPVDAPVPSPEIP